MAGIALSGIIGSNPYNVLMAFVPLSALVVLANYKSSCVVHIPTLNVQRGELALRDCISSAQAPYAASVLSPSQVASQVRGFTAPMCCRDCISAQ